MFVLVDLEGRETVWEEVLPRHDGLYLPLWLYGRLERAMFMSGRQVNLMHVGMGVNRLAFFGYPVHIDRGPAVETLSFVEGEQIIAWTIGHHEVNDDVIGYLGMVLRESVLQVATMRMGARRDRVRESRYDPTR
jgi:hypothetical protein